MTNQATPDLNDEQLYRRFSRRETVAGWRVGVVTTGIYCRSGCPARTPKPENVRFFASARLAREAGFRACKRCHPDEDTALSAREQEIVVQAVRLLDEEGSRTAATLARRLGVSAAVLDRLIRRSTGVSLAVLDESRKFGRLRASLPGAESVTEAIYEAGFAGPRRVYEKGDEMLGMTAGRFRSGGSGERLGLGIAPCALGVIGIAATRKGISLLSVRRDEEAVHAEVARLFHRAIVEPDPEIQGWAELVAAAVNQRQPMPRFPIDVQATAFEAQVWQALLAIPRGQTRSYGDVARSINNPKAFRAVGRACGANPVALLIPCHRAVGSDGTLTGFAFGIDAKARLLQDEGALIEASHGTLF
jgi:AraC family transcriptional regulator, regulatory protein of adaptative response / methylated-DNA-[protein]-cysteine methyltransferase